MYKRLCIVDQISQDYISADTFLKSWIVSWNPIIKLKLFASRVIEHTNLTLGFTDKYKNILNQWKRISNFIVDFCGHRRDFREWRTPQVSYCYANLQNIEEDGLGCKSRNAHWLFVPQINAESIAYTIVEPHCGIVCQRPCAIQYNFLNLKVII